MKKIIVAGLGAGDFNQMPLGVYRLLKSGKPIFVRTNKHPVMKELEKEGVSYQSFDHLYEKHEEFNKVYEEIVETLSKKAEQLHEIIYAVPGHPFVAEKTVQLLLANRKYTGVEIEFSGGQSFLDALFQAVQIDPIEGFQLIDGTNIQKEMIQIRQHIIISQVYDFFIASQVKLTLMELLPDTYEVYMITNAGNELETVKKIPLYEIDHHFEVSNLTSIYVPPVKDEEILYKDFHYLRNIIKTLRGPNGCPWDKQQTHQSLKKYLLEETNELLQAIDEEDDDHIVEELGDVLLQVMMHAQIGEDEGYFTIDDVIQHLVKKLIQRHPHVFSDRKATTAEEVKEIWQEMKEKEKEKKDR